MARFKNRTRLRTRPASGVSNKLASGGSAYIVFGYDDPDTAPVLLATDNRERAIKWAKDYNGACYEHDFKDGCAVNMRLICP